MKSCSGTQWIQSTRTGNQFSQRNRIFVELARTLEINSRNFLQSCSAVGVTVGMEEMGDCRKDTGSTGSDALGGDKNNQREESDNKNIYGFMLPHTDI